MRSSTQRLVLMASLAWSLVGFRHVEMTSTPSTTPLLRPVDATTPTNFKQCNFFALGWIPVTEKTTLDAIIQQMSAGADGLVNVSVDSATTNFGLISWQCWKVAATPFTWRPDPPPPVPEGQAQADESAPADAATATTPEAAPVAVSTGTIVADVSAPPPTKAEPLTARLLSQLGLKRPDENDAYQQLITDVWNLRQQHGLSDRDMVQTARVGAGKVAPGSDLLTVLRAGL